MTYKQALQIAYNRQMNEPDDYQEALLDKKSMSLLIETNGHWVVDYLTWEIHTINAIDKNTLEMQTIEL